MTPDELVKATDGVELKISELNQKIIDKIVENLLLRFEKTGKVVFSPSDEYSIMTLRQAGVTQADILAEIQKATPGIQKEVKKAFKQAATNIGRVKINKYVQQKMNNPIPEGANETGTASEKIIDGRINEKELSARQKELLEDVYSRTKNEINKIYEGVARSGSNEFQDACNEAARMVRSGMGPQKAVREAIKKVAKDGTYIQYPSGHKDTIEVAVLRAVRTGVNQANAKLVLDLAEATGQDLVLVSSHEDARPAHQEWQGKIYSLSGKSKKYPEFRSATGFGTVQGLCGANCRHTFTIYYPGFSKNPYKRNNKQSNKKKYDYTQEQRKRERDIRKQKRIIDALEKAKAETNDPELKRELQAEIDTQKAKLRDKKRDYDDFCKAHGLKKQAIRTHTYKSGPVENKSVWEKKEPDVKTSGRATTYKNSIKTPMEKGKNKGYTKRTKEDPEQTARQIKDEITQYSDRPSKWSGNIDIDNSLLDKGILGTKEWSCNITLVDTVDNGVVWHEMLHSCSVSYYKSEIYNANEYIEEATVEWLKQQICSEKNIFNVYAYGDKTIVLQALNEFFKFGTDMEFAKEIFNIPLPERYQWLENRVDERLRRAGASFEDYNDVMGFVERLKGGSNGRH